jgi:hypothetical protein
MATRTEVIYRKNPDYTPGGTEPEMLSETVEYEVTTVPRVLSKTAFQDYAITQLGGGITGMGRFTEIMDATRDSAAGAVRFAFARYEAAVTFEKENSALLTQIMAADTTPGHLTAAERLAIIDNWPEA